MPPPALRPAFVAYLDRLIATHSRGTVTGTASRLNHFAAHLAAVDPHLASLAELDRRRHIETYLTATTEAVNSRTGAPISVSERRGRVLAISCLLNDITEWGWAEAPERQLGVPLRHPKTAPGAAALPHPRPRPAPDPRAGELAGPARRRRAAAATRHRACASANWSISRLDCVHEIPGQGAWLKVPLGKLEHRTDGAPRRGNRRPHRPHRRPPLTRPSRCRTRAPGGPPTSCSPTTAAASPSITCASVLTRVARDAGLPHITPHQLRHTYATALVNAGVSLQSLMALLGHVSAEMSLRYGRLFDATVQSRIRTGPDRCQGPPRHAAHRPAQGPHTRCPMLDGRLERSARGQGPPRRRLLHPRPGPRPLRLRQHLRALPQLPHRHRLPARAGRTTRRHRNPRARRRSPRLDQRSRSAPPPHRTPRRPHPPGADRMTAPDDRHRRVEDACAELVLTGQPVTFDDVAQRTGLGRATLYRNPELRAVVEEHRARGREAHTLSGLATEIAHLRIAVEALAATVRRHEEELRRLRPPKSRR